MKYHLINMIFESFDFSLLVLNPPKILIFLGLMQLCHLIDIIIEFLFKTENLVEKKFLLFRFNFVDSIETLFMIFLLIVVQLLYLFLFLGERWWKRLQLRFERRLGLFEPIYLLVKSLVVVLLGSLELGQPCLCCLLKSFVVQQQLLVLLYIVQ